MSFFLVYPLGNIKQCELCNRTLKDSVAYVDHVNGRSRELNSSPKQSHLDPTHMSSHLS